MTGLAVIDAGNTSCTVGLFQNRQLVGRWGFSQADADLTGAIETCLETACASRPEVRLAGTQPHTVARLEAALRPRFLLHVAPQDFTAPIQNLCHPAQDVGLDRLFCAAAAAAQGDLPVVIVDAGTAITVDLVDANGSFRGGAIAPGLRISFLALHRQTGALPLIEPSQGGEELEPLGTNTRDAIQIGVVRGLAGLVDRLVEEVGGQERARVVLTGGDASRLSPYLRCDFVIEPDLILYGLAMGRR